MSEHIEDFNGVRYRGRGDHVESYFVKATAPDAERALWLKATIFARQDEPLKAVAEGWAIAFDRRNGAHRDVAVKHSLSYDQASFSAERLQIDWRLPGDDASLLLTPEQTRGVIASGGHRLRWELRCEGDRRPFVMLPFMQMYTGPLPSSKTVTPQPDLRLFGELEVDGERWEIDGWRGMQGHNWGRGHAEQYAWCHCNQWDDADELVVEAVSARVRVGPVLMPVLTVVYARHRGVDYAFNAPRVLALARGELGLRRYHFSAETRFASIAGLLEAPTEDFVGLYYPNPAGPMTYCLNSKLASARVRFEAKGRPVLEARSRAAALEVGTRKADHGVTMHV